MAQSDNFLRGWNRQVQHALEEGTELSYEAAELIEELLELLSPGDSHPEMGESDGGGRSDSETLLDATLGGHRQADLPGIPGVGSGVEPLLVPERDDNPPRVPRGTREPVTGTARTAKVVKRG